MSRNDLCSVEKCLTIMTIMCWIFHNHMEVVFVMDNSINSGSHQYMISYVIHMYVFLVF